MLPHYPSLVLSSVAGLAFNVATHMLLSRLRKGGGQMLCLLGGLIAGFACTAAVSVAALPDAGTARDAVGYLGINVFTYGALAWCYFHFVNLSLASLRIRLLHEMAHASGGLSGDEILRKYDAGQIIENRLERLARGNHLVVRDGRFRVGNPAFVILFDLFELLKHWILRKGNRLLAGAAGEGRANGGRATDPPETWRTVKGILSLLLQYDLFRFLLVGGVNTLFSYLLYASLILLGLDYRVTLTVCTVITIIWNYFTTGRFVFDNRGLGLIFKFVAVYGLIYVMNLHSLTFLVDRGVGPLLGQALVIPLIVVTSFSLNKLWVFRRTGVGFNRS